LAGNQLHPKTPKHGHFTNNRPTRVYRIWTGIKTRCNNPNDPGFKHYGARGISICDRWLVFENFLSDMGEPGRGMSIDRIDVNGNYEPGNCRWATSIVQHRNRRDNVFIEYNGVRATIAEWSETTGINRSTIRSRIISGLPPERVLDKRISSKSDSATFGNSVRWHTGA